MGMIQYETFPMTVASGKRCDDRTMIVEQDGGVILVVADGAGGTGDGDIAAQFVIDEIARHASLDHDAGDWCQILSNVDSHIRTGESTCVVAAVTEKGITGASVGDSQAWMIADHEIHSLTKHQIRKPLLGSGSSRPIGFSSEVFPGVLLLATDGFCNYVQRGKLTHEDFSLGLNTLSQRLVEMVRLPSGALWDDIGIIICRPIPQ